MYQQFFNTILQDHSEIRDTMQRLTEMRDEPEIKKKALFAEFEFEIVPHMKAEEGAYYSALKGKTASEQDALKAIEEHRIAQSMVNEMKNIPVNDGVWQAKMKVLNEFVQTHFDNEEKNTFQDTTRVFKEEEITRIYNRYREEKDRAKARFP